MSLKSSDDPSRYISVQQTLVEPIVNAIRVPDFKVECPIKSSHIWTALTAHPESFSYKRDMLIGGDALTFCMTIALQGCFPRSAKLINIFRKALLSKEVLAELLCKMDPAGSRRHDVATAHDILKAAIGHVFNKQGPDAVLRWMFCTFKDLIVEAMHTMSECLENGSLRLWLDLEEVKALHGGVCPPEREPEKSVEKEFEEDIALPYD